MREIKFRSKSKSYLNSGDWVYGYLHEQGCHLCIGDSIVFRETVGQYTGLKDKNGMEIYEGDVVDTIDGVGKVIYEDLLCAFAIEYKASKIAFIHYVTQEDATLEVIGNIYENKELLA